LEQETAVRRRAADRRRPFCRLQWKSPASARRGLSTTDALSRCSRIIAPGRLAIS
jgi:hypothetical protein